MDTAGELAIAMRIVQGRPPIYDEIVRVIGRPPADAVFTWGDTLFVPKPPRGMVQPISQVLLEHEKTHSRQQEIIGGPAEWWRIYLENPAFRLQQELAAYRNPVSIRRGVWPQSASAPAVAPTAGQRHVRADVWTGHRTGQRAARDRFVIASVFTPGTSLSGLQPGQLIKDQNGAWQHRCPACGHYFDVAREHGIVTAGQTIECPRCDSSYRPQAQR